MSRRRNSFFRWVFSPAGPDGPAGKVGVADRVRLSRNLGRGVLLGAREAREARFDIPRTLDRSSNIPAQQNLRNIGDCFHPEG